MRAAWPPACHGQLRRCTSSACLLYPMEQPSLHHLEFVFAVLGSCLTCQKSWSSATSLASIEAVYIYGISTGTNLHELIPFLQGLERLTKVIFARALPKRLGNHNITGPMLAVLATQYVEAINEGAVPTIATAWQVGLSV